jgi:hypothetical protein
MFEIAPSFPGEYSKGEREEREGELKHVPL